MSIAARLVQHLAEKPVDRLMAAIVRLRQERGTVTEADLLAEGFTQAEIDAHGEAARDKAVTAIRRAGR